MIRSSRIIVVNVIIWLIFCTALVVLATKFVDQRKQLQAQETELRNVRESLQAMQNVVHANETRTENPVPRTLQTQESGANDLSLIVDEVVNLSTQVQHVTSRLTSLERTVEAPIASAPPVHSVSDEFRRRVSDLERAVDEVRANPRERLSDSADWSAIESRIDRIADDHRDLSQKLDRFESTMREIEWEGDSGNLPRLVREFGRRLDSVESTVRSIESDRDRINLQRSVDQLDSQVSGLDRQIDSLADRVRRLESDR